MQSIKQESVELAAVRSFFVGGVPRVLSGLPVTFKSMVLNGAPREVNPNGEHVAGQMYVQEFRLAAPRHPIPILLWHGGGMTGCTWETKPDGGTGWAWRLLQAGYDVLVCDSAERGRSSFGMTPHIYPNEPVFRTKEEGWTTFRIGDRYSSDPACRHVHPNQCFPVKHFDEFAKQWVPRWPGNEAMILDAYEALVRIVGRCIVIAHSQGAGFAAEIANRLPESIAALVAIEPGGVPARPVASALPPQLVVWGDHIEQSGLYWQRYRSQASAYFELASHVGLVEEFDLPRRGISGNSHFIMMDRNSDEVLTTVREWLARASYPFKTHPIKETA